MGKDYRRSLLLVSGFALLLLLVGFTPLRFLIQTGLQQPIPLEQVQRVKWLRDRTIYIQGRVSDRVPLIGSQVYQIEDRTGNLWVVSSNTQRQPGESVKIKGVVRFESIVIEGNEVGNVYVEEE